MQEYSSQSEQATPKLLFDQADPPWIMPDHRYSASARSAKDGARDHEVLDARRACALERPCELVQGRTGRHDVVQHGDARSREIERAEERFAHVFRALLVGKFRLRQRVLHAQHATRLDRSAPVSRELAGNLEGLIESAL